MKLDTANTSQVSHVLQLFMSPSICWPPTKHSVWRGQFEATAFRCACTLDEPKNTCPTCVDFQCYQEWKFQKKRKNSKVGRWKVNFQETNLAQELQQKTHLGNLQTGRAGSYFHSFEKRLWKKTSLPWCPLPKPNMRVCKISEGLDEGQLANFPGGGSPPILQSWMLPSRKPW